MTLMLKKEEGNFLLSSLKFNFIHPQVPKFLQKLVYQQLKKLLVTLTLKLFEQTCISSYVLNLTEL